MDNRLVDSLLQRNRVNPVRKAVGNALVTLGTGKPQTEDDDISSKLMQSYALKQMDRDPEMEDLKRRDIESRIGLRSELGKFGQQQQEEGEDGEPSMIVANGRLVRNPAYKRLPTPQERNIEIEDAVAKNEMTEMSKMLPKLDQANQAQSQLKTLFDSAVSPTSVGKEATFIDAIGARLSGIPKTGAAFLGMNPELNRYKSGRKAFSGLLAKGGFGESGMLTQQDIERVASLLPTEYSTKEEADIAWNEIGTILSSARKRFDDKRASYMNPSQASNQPSQPVDYKSKYGLD